MQNPERKQFISLANQRGKYNCLEEFMFFLKVQDPDFRVKSVNVIVFACLFFPSHFCSVNHIEKVTQIKNIQLSELLQSKVLLNQSQVKKQDTDLIL